MQENLLREFSLPNINLECLQKVLSRNTIRLAKLLKEHNEFVKKSKITPPGYKGFSVSILPELADPTDPEIKADPTDPEIEADPTDPEIKADPTDPEIKEDPPSKMQNPSIGENENGRVKIVPLEKLLAKTNFNNNEAEINVVNGDRNEPVELEKEKKVEKVAWTIASDLGWGSEDEEECAGKNGNPLEVRPYPSRPDLEQEDLISWKVGFSSFKSNLHVNKTCDVEPKDAANCDFLYWNDRESDETACLLPESRILSAENDSEETSESSPKGKTAKPIRCYHRKKSKPAVPTFDPDDENLSDGTIGNEEEEPPVCVISEIIGNAEEAFSRESSAENSLITPKKTNDITKIKGWRRKQFLVEKPTTVEFFSYENGSSKKMIKLDGLKPPEKEAEDQEPDNVENAFVCDSLDEFLDREAELKINYEIPHLYAEVGIKLTSEHLVSKPNLSQKDFEEVGDRYCVQLPVGKEELSLPDDDDDRRGEKRRGGEDSAKSFKMMKVNRQKRRPIKIEQKLDQSKCQVSKWMDDTCEYPSIPDGFVKEENSKAYLNLSEDVGELPPNLSLTTKLLGVVVYPGSSKPVHPVVESHLNKIRSYRTKIDRNWADFAASAVHGKWQRRQLNRRKILPVFCTGKVEAKPASDTVEGEVESVVKFLVDSVCENFTSDQGRKRRLDFDRGFSAVKKFGPPHRSKSVDLNLKECKVVVDKIDAGKYLRHWCMEHNRYDCSTCGRHSFGFKNGGGGSDYNDGIIKIEEISRFSNSDKDSSPVLFDHGITHLLAKRLRDVAFHEDILTSIDKLKTLVPNGLELIKLNFVKQSFLTGYVNIWYLKPTSEAVRSRAFLTFSKTPPVPKAINVKKRQNSAVGLPKVITELVSPDSVFNEDEYAILHCNGKLWEIHGSLNVAVEKTDDAEEEKEDAEIEQIFIPIPLAEMEEIRKMAMKILGVKATKWWVLDLTQKFTEIVLSISCKRTIITRKHIFSVIKSKYFGFLSIKKRKGRLYGIYLLDSLLPFVLVGPYYTFEKCTLFLRSNFSKITFDYNGLENPVKDCSLRFFINSVIKGVEGGGTGGGGGGGGGEKKLNGLWLYDKNNLDEGCYLETIATNNCGLFPKSDYSIDTEHGYGLNCLTNPTILESTSAFLRSKNGRMTLKIPVYLYFEIFDLGYISGELQLDNSILICHPLSPGIWIKSHKIGDLFISVLRRRIKFIPDDFVPRWYVTRHREDLRDRQPFNKFFLGGAHVLCKNGLYSLLKITENKIRELGLKKEEIMEAISGSKVIQEVCELRSLKALIINESNENFPMDQVLNKAVQAIDELEKKNAFLMNTKCEAEKKKLRLYTEYLSLLGSIKISDHLKVKYLQRVIGLFGDRKNPERMDESFKRLLEKFEFGRKFLEKFEVNASEKKESDETAERTDEKAATVGKTVGKTAGKKPVGNSKLAGISKAVKTKVSDNDVLRRLEAKLFRVCEVLEKSENVPNVPEYRRLIKKLNAISNQIDSVRDVMADESGEKTRRKSLRTKKNQSGNSNSIKVKTKSKSSTKRSRGGQEKKKVTEEKKKSVDESIKPETEATNQGNSVDCKKKDVSGTMQKIDRSENSSPMNSEKDNMLVAPMKANGDGFSILSGKKFFVIKRGKTNSRPKLNVLQAIKVFKKEWSEIRKVMKTGKK